jgi:hypothetical protein
MWQCLYVSVALEAPSGDDGHKVGQVSRVGVPRAIKVNGVYVQAAVFIVQVKYMQS